MASRIDTSGNSARVRDFSPILSSYRGTLWRMDLGVSLPFDFFITDVLGMLGITPSQLHPNSWATIQAFKTICSALSILPTAPILFSSYTRLPNKVKGLTRGQLQADGRASWDILNQLPRGINYKEVVAASFVRNSLPYLKDIFAKLGYELGTLMKKGGGVAKDKLEKVKDEAAKAKAILAVPTTTQTKISFKPAPPPPSPTRAGVKRKEAPTTIETAAKKGKAVEGALVLKPTPTPTPAVVTTATAAKTTTATTKTVTTAAAAAQPTTVVAFTSPMVITPTGPTAGVMELGKGGFPNYTTSLGAESLWDP
ncbi:hypothetical protein CR513_53132, partial [Mucuna pruriens]